MRKLGRRFLVLLVIFIAAAAGLLFFRHSDERGGQPEAEYQEITGASLPVVSTEVGGTSLNYLPAFTSEVDVAAMEDSLMLVGSDGRLPLTVSLSGNTLASITWEIRTRDNSRSVGSGSVEQWDDGTDTAKFSLDLAGVVANTSREYRLILTLTTENEQTFSYYTRVVRSDDMHAEEMIAFITSFHQNIFNKSAAAGYTSYLENDGSADNTNLAEVTIHCSFDQLTYGDLAPTQVGDVSMRILEMDDTFGSFCLEYEIEAEGDGGSKQRFLAEEYYSVQWTQTRFYLMNYRRTLAQVTGQSDAALAGGVLDLGIQQEAVQTASNSEAGVTAFTTADELFSYRREGQVLTRIYTMREEQSGQPVSFRNYGIKLLKVDDTGDVFFLIYGYMTSGRHQGSLGIACMTYQAETNSLAEKFFLPANGSCETLAEGINTLSHMGMNDTVYVMLDDAVYSIDWNGGEVSVLADQTEARDFITNEDQTAVAFSQSMSDGQADSVEILYLDSGESRNVGADSGEFVRPLGFIGSDCVIGRGHKGETAVAGGITVAPMYSLVILGEDGQEATRYEKENIYISSVEVERGQILLNRLKKKKKNFSEIETDTLISSDADRTRKASALSRGKDSKRQAIFKLSVDSEKAEGSLSLQMPEAITYDSETNISPVRSEKNQTLYYAFAEGHLKLITDKAGDAIDSVYDKMGAVSDSRGRQIWVRTGRDQTRELTSKVDGPFDESESLLACLSETLEIQGMDSSAISQVTADMPAFDALNTLFPGQAINLTGSPMRALLYYVDQSNPVLLVDRDKKVCLLVGYDLWNVIYYDPTTGSLTRQGQNDATKWLQTEGISAIGFLPDY